jgi:hypothetical protein
VLTNVRFNTLVAVLIVAEFAVGLGWYLSYHRPVAIPVGLAPGGDDEYRVIFQDGAITMVEYEPWSKVSYSKIYIDYWQISLIPILAGAFAYIRVRIKGSSNAIGGGFPVEPSQKHQQSRDSLHE